MEPGRVVKRRYHLEAEVARGGVGAVFRARDPDGGLAAVKVLQHDAGRSSERFMREAQLLSQLDHPGIVRYLDTGITERGEPFFIMEWLEGEDLRTRLQRGPLGVGEALDLVARIASALHHAHERGVIHRDVKPDNIFLPHGRLGEAKLLDFGAAHWSELATLTRTGMMVGTPMYMAPEQARGERDIAPTVDVFALGCVLFECLTGQCAFVGESVVAVLYKILLEQPPAVSELVPGVPSAVDRLVAQLLAKSPSSRPQTGRAVARAAEGIAGRGPAESSVTGPSRADAEERLTRTERRLVSAVVVAGSMSIKDWLRGQGGRPPPEHGSLDRIRRRFAPMGARFEQLGDGSVIAVFDTDNAATDRASDAARCALALRADFPAQAIAAATGRASPAQPRVLSEVIERAIRLLGIDQARGGIRVDDTTADLVRTRFRLERAEDHIALLGEREDDTSEPRLLGRVSPFVGRRREMTLLTATLEQCLEERDGYAVLITGPAGVGKSRLRREFTRHVATHGADVAIWRGRGDSMRVGSALGPLVQIIRTIADIREDEPLSVRQDKLRARVARAVPEPDVWRVTVFLGEVSGTSWPSADHAQLAAARRDARLMSEQIRRAFLDLVQAEARERALVIEIDDLHWCDRATGELLDRVLQQVRQPVMVVGLGRPAVYELFPGLWAERGVTEVRLRPLGSRAAEQLVRSLLGEVPRAERLQQLVEHAGGNPLFLEELVRSAAVGGEVSDTVLAMIEVRLRALAPKVRQVLRAASVFGTRFWKGGLVALLGGEAPVEQALAPLLEEEAIVVVSASKFAGEIEFSFRHDLERDAAYQMLTDEDRALGHRLAGEWLERVGESDARMLAEHFELGGAAGRAGEFYLRAGRDALELLEFEQARDRFHAALRLTPDPHDDRRGAQVACKACIGLVEISRLMGRRASSASERDDGDDSAARLEWARTLASRFDLDDALASIHFLWGSLLFSRGEVDGCLEHHEHARRYAESSGSRYLEARALGGLGDAHYIRGRMISAHDAFARAVALAQRHAFDDIAAANLSMCGITRFYQNDVRAGLLDTLDAVAAAARAEQRRAEIVARNGCAAWILYELGDYDEALAQLDRALELAEDSGISGFEANSLGFSARIHSQRGEDERARECGLAAVAASRAHDMAFVGPMALGALALATRGRDEARALLDEGWALLADNSFSHNHLWFHRDAIDVTVRLQEPDQVERHADAMAAYTRAQPLAWSDFHIARARALAAALRGRGERAQLEALLQRAQRAEFEPAARSLEAALAGLG